MTDASAAQRDVLLCDLDGTLIDSAPDLANALNVLLEEHGRRHLSRESVTYLVGDGARALVTKGFAETGDAATPEAMDGLAARFVEIYSGMATAETRPYPNSVEVLQTLRAEGWRLAVCTNKPEGLSRQILDGLALSELFDAVAGGDSYEVRKPDPGHVLQLLGELDAPPERAIMLGDSENDFRAGRAAGLPVVLVSFGYGKGQVPRLGAERIIDDFAELPAALSKL